MVVDDEVGAANSLCDFLQDLGYLVSAAYNGEEAVCIFESEPPDLVITDLRMPVMDGAQLIANLRAQAPDLPIFVMTGHGVDNDEESAEGLGATEVWKKPLSLSEVARRLESFCA